MSNYELVFPDSIYTLNHKKNVTLYFDYSFACIVGFSGSAISNMLSKISREPRELPWQPNFGKNEPKLNETFCLDRIVRRTNVVKGS